MSWTVINILSFREFVRSLGVLCKSRGTSWVYVKLSWIRQLINLLPLRSCCY